MLGSRVPATTLWWQQRIGFVVRLAGLVNLTIAVCFIALNKVSVPSI